MHITALIYANTEWPCQRRRFSRHSTGKNAKSIFFYEHWAKEITDTLLIKLKYKLFDQVWHLHYVLLWGARKAVKGAILWVSANFIVYLVRTCWMCVSDGYSTFGSNQNDLPGPRRSSRLHGSGRLLSAHAQGGRIHFHVAWQWCQLH